jgi:hypothetical protein
LVPNGTYSVWCVRLTFPPNWQEVYTPCGAPDGSQNVFKADAQGSAAFALKLKTLPPSTNLAAIDGDFEATINFSGVVQSVSTTEIVLTNGTVVSLYSGTQVIGSVQVGQTITVLAGIEDSRIVAITITGGTTNGGQGVAVSPDTVAETASVIVLVYHSNDQPHGSTPGDFGLTSHVQLLAFIPAFSVTTQVNAATPAATADCTDTKNAHPVAARLAEAFGVPYDEIMRWHCQAKYGFGEIARAYLLAQATDKTVDEIFAMRANGQGWGQIVKSLGVKPSDLAPGSVIKGKGKGKGKGKDK